MIKLKVPKKQGFTLSLEIIYFWKNHRGSQIEPPAFLGLMTMHENRRYEALINSRN